MAERPILYVKTGGPPADWREMRVHLARGGKLVPDVREANAHEGWYVQALRRPDGHLDIDPRTGTYRTRKVYRKIKITRRPTP